MGCCPKTRCRQLTGRYGFEPLEEDEWPHRELRLGFDTQARLLEAVVLIFEGGEEMVIHAMPDEGSSGTLP